MFQVSSNEFSTRRRNLCQQGENNKKIIKESSSSSYFHEKEKKFRPSRSFSLSRCCLPKSKIRYRSVSPGLLTRENTPKKTFMDSPMKVIAVNKANHHSKSMTQLTAPSIKLPTIRALEIQKCRKLFENNGYPIKVLLYPEESWARNATSAHWIITPIWWRSKRCKVVEIAGTKRYTTSAKMIDADSGSLRIVGSFHKCSDPEFKLMLTSNITLEDFNTGYCMTGYLERGSYNNFQTTHFAVVRRAEFNN